MTFIETAINQARQDDLAKLTEHTTRSYKGDTAEDTGWKREQTWRFADGECVTLEGGFDGYDLLPASAGFELLTFEGSYADDPAAADISKYVSRLPVIGWAKTNDNCRDLVLPITIEGFDRTSRIWAFKAISFPDGRIGWHAPFQNRSQYDEIEPICISLEEWIDLVREVWAEVIKRQEEELQRRAEAEKPCPHCGRHNGMLDDEFLI